MPPGRAERKRGDRHPWPRHDAIVDRRSQGDVDVLGCADVAHRRKTGLERVLRVRRGADGGIDRAPPECVGVILVALGREMRVHVDQTGEEGAPPEIDGLHAGWDRQPAADLRHAIALDEHDGFVHALAGNRIYQVSGPDRDATRGGHARLSGVSDDA